MRGHCLAGETIACVRRCFLNIFIDYLYSEFIDIKDFALTSSLCALTTSLCAYYIQNKINNIRIPTKIDGTCKVCKWKRSFENWRKLSIEFLVSDLKTIRKKIRPHANSRYRRLCIERKFNMLYWHSKISSHGVDSKYGRPT